MFCVSADTVHCRRSHGVQELQAKKVQPWHSGGHAAVVQWIASFIKYGQIDPREGAFY
jgi:hypothetical protein